MKAINFCDALDTAPEPGMCWQIYSDTITANLVHWSDLKRPEISDASATIHMRGETELLLGEYV